MGDPSILFNNAGPTMGKSKVKEISDINIEELSKRGALIAARLSS
jgi:hypothetical protein